MISSRPADAHLADVIMVVESLVSSDELPKISVVDTIIGGNLRLVAMNSARPTPGQTFRMQLLGVHHVAIICSDYERSKRFYVEVLGCAVVAEHLRAERQSFKLDLAVPGGTQIELFSFPDPPPRPTRPEACGLRHLAFAVHDLDAWTAHLRQHSIVVEDIRTDEYTGRRFFFFSDPDGLPIELYEVPFFPARAPLG